MGVRRVAMYSIHRPYIGTLCALNIFILARAFAPAPLQVCATVGIRRSFSHTSRKDGGFQKLKSCERHPALRHAAGSNGEPDRSGAEATIHSSFNLTSARISERECSCLDCLEVWILLELTLVVSFGRRDLQACSVAFALRIEPSQRDLSAATSSQKRMEWTMRGIHSSLPLHKSSAS